MPEGPEIRRAADQVARAIVGRRAEAVRFGLPALRRHERGLAGRRVEAVESRGKALLIHFDHGRSLYTHNQLYGRWYVVKPGKPPGTGRELRLAIETRERWALLYSASDIELWRRDTLDRHPYLAKLGVELLDPKVLLSEVLAQVQDPCFARRRLGGLLLDQGFLAGIGNYLRSEILFVAGLRADQRLADLDETARRRLAEAALSLTRQSYRTKGVTNDLERAASLKEAGLSFGRYRHHVFDRAGEPCWTCATPIVRLTAAGRSVFECPRCQSS